MDATALLLDMLKVDLGIKNTAAYDERLTQCIASAEKSIAEEGVVNLDPLGNPADAQLIVMYAAYQFRQRDTMGAMPRMLRYALNNRVLSSVAGR